jgi:hypothetical protein
VLPNSKVFRPIGLVEAGPASKIDTPCLGNPCGVVHRPPQDVADLIELE